jgi:hypothetical protein
VAPKHDRSHEARGIQASRAGHGSVFHPRARPRCPPSPHKDAGLRQSLPVRAYVRQRDGAGAQVRCP